MQIAAAANAVAEGEIASVELLLPGGHGAVSGFARLDAVDSGSRLAQVLDIEAILRGLKD